MIRKTIKTRILIISDTHAALPATSGTREQPFHAPLPDADVLIHCGDLTGNGALVEHERALALLHAHPASLKVVIPGNHDLTLDKAYYAEHPHLHGPYPAYSHAQLAQVQELYDGPAARAAGITYLVEGTRVFTLPSGARFRVYASGYTPEFCQWAFAYERDVDRFSTEAEAENPVPDVGVDVLVTHGPPYGMLDKVVRGNVSVGCEHLWKAVERCRPQVHCFGHVHEGWGAKWKRWDGNEARKDVPVPAYAEQVERGAVFVDATGLEVGKETLFVNASIMDVRYRPVQAPWLVDLELELNEA